MRTFYELLDDVAIPARWHLGQICTADGFEPRLRAGLAYTGGRIHAVVTKPGRSLAFCLSSFAIPVATVQLANAISSFAESDLQCVPLTIPAQAGFVVLNVLRIIRCVDEPRSEFVKWTERDHRYDLAGQYRQVTSLRLDPSLVPDDGHIFRIQGWLVGLVVSAPVKAAMENAGCLGALFREVPC